MKASGYNIRWKKMKYRWQILKTSIINTFQHETAYFAENWTNLFSTVFYTAAMLLFINVLYSNVKTFAGYTFNEMMFLSFVGQMGFYISWGIFDQNDDLLMDDIQKGTLDFVLIKPVPSLFFVSFRRIALVSTLRDGVPTLVVLGSLVQWSALPFGFTNTIFGTLIFICGLVLWHCIRFLLIFPAFWLGNAKGIYSVSYKLTETNNLPLQGYGNGFRIFFSVVVPILFLSAISGSVMLGKSDGGTMLFYAFFVTTIFLAILNLAWKSALKNYTSASS